MILNRPLMMILIILGGFFVPKNCEATRNIRDFQVSQDFFVNTDKPDPFKNKLKRLYHKLAASDKPRHKLALSALTITLGVFGAHRLYLGTEPHVPVLYALTLGGGLGIVPLVDLIHILASEDPMIYQNDKRFFMWGKREEQSSEE